jgi:hypothetical protein
MKITIKFLFLAAYLCFHIQSYAQLMMDDIDLELIEQKKIRKYIECQIEEGKHQFYELHPSWTCGKDLSSYRKKEMTFFLKGGMQDIWQGYVSANPSNSWDGRKTSYGLLLLKFPSNIYYFQDPIKGVDTGQVYFLNLKIMLGLCNIPVAFEIITLDAENKIIEFSYIEGNKSIGVQQVKFIDLGEDHTEIVHTSYYKSDSQFRDRWMYPFFHKKIINDFHRNMRKLLNLKKQNENEINTNPDII